MQQVYEEIKTPFKYRLVMLLSDISRLSDSPSVFRTVHNLYIFKLVNNRRGYKTYLALSDNLLDWKSFGKVLSFSYLVKRFKGSSKGYLEAV